MPASLIFTLALLALLSIVGLDYAPIILMLAIMSYALFLISGSITIARRHGFDLVFALPLTIAVFHISYGLGFFHALLVQFLSLNFHPTAINR